MKPLCILGPTASGKSSAAMAVAAQVDGVELVSIDSMQVYRGMDVGTAKPTSEEQAQVRHHLIDIADPADEFTVSMFQQAWRGVRDEVIGRGAIPVLVGGTGLYLRSVIDDLEIPARYPEVRAEIEERATDIVAMHRELEGLDPLAASRIDPRNDRRIIRALEVTLGSGRRFSSYGPGLEEYGDIPFTLLGLRMSREQLDARIDARYDLQMEHGFLDEVRALIDRPGGIGRTARQALGYRELLRHVEERLPLDVALDDAKVRTRRFARRQLKWFQRDPRIEWVDLDASGAIDHDAAIATAIERARSSAA
ncbi:MAG: tRNA (adenosine(37)-N6)-dimethylallyltransferase MiaA [Acidimicrobiales bacterium]